MIKAYIGIGSNLGRRPVNIKKAVEQLKKVKNIKVRKISSLYETKPVGGPPQRKYLNGVIEIETNLRPHRLLKELKSIEKYLGRSKTVRNGPRIIDLDILLYGNKKIKTKTLTVPHPRMWLREFVVKPLRQVYEVNS